MKIIVTHSFWKGLWYIKSFYETEFSWYNNDSHTNDIIFKGENQKRKVDTLREH